MSSSFCVHILLVSSSAIIEQSETIQNYIFIKIFELKLVKRSINLNAIYIYKQMYSTVI